MIAIHLSKQQVLDADPKAIQQINFTRNLAPDENAYTTFLIFEEVKETIFDFSQGTVNILWIYFTLIYYQHKMNRCNTLSIKLPNSQLNKLTSRIKNGTK